jgi:hypothetical protein
MDSQTRKFLRRGILVTRQEELVRLRQEAQAYKDSLDFMFIPHPFDPENIDLEKCRNLMNALLDALEKIRTAKAVMEEVAE